MAQAGARYTAGLMRIDIHVHLHGPACDGRAILSAISDLKETFMTTQTELAATLNATAEQVTKIGNETRTLLAKIDDLTTQLGEGTVSPEVDAAVAALKEQVSVVDALVPDAS